MDEEIEALPQGWTVEEEVVQEPELKPQQPEPQKQEKTPDLPQGWKVETEEDKLTNELKDAAGPYYVEPKSKEDLQKMSVREKMQYFDELDTMGQYLQSAGFTKGLLSGATFGLSENIDVLKPKPQETGGTLGEVVGSVLPLSGLIKVFQAPLVGLASKSPVLQSQLTALAELTGLVGAGATDKAIRDVGKGKVPTADELLEHGAEWALLDIALRGAGKLGSFVKSLYDRTKAVNKPSFEVINETINELRALGEDFSNPTRVSAKALEILERKPLPGEIASKKIELPKEKPNKVSEAAEGVLKQEPIKPEDLKTKKVSDEPINRLTKDVIPHAEPYEPAELNFSSEAEALERSALDAEIDSVSARAATEEELGVAIKEDIEKELAREREAYAPFYKQAKEKAGYITHIPQEIAHEAGEKLVKILELKTQPAGYAAVIRNLETSLEDAGFTIQRDKAGRIEQIISTKNVPVSKTIELAARLNEIIDYEAIEPTVKNVLKKVAAAAKRDVRAGLAKDPDALAAFNLAEENHARVAQKYGRESISRIRKTQAGEKVARVIESPSTLGELKNTVTQKQYKQIEREILERMKDQSYDKAKKTYRELEKHFTDDTKRVAKDIVESKNPHNPEVRARTTKEGVVNEVSKALTDGTRPEKTLNLWKTKKGQNLVREAFKGSPNWPAVEKYLQTQSFNDMISSVLKPNGTLDLKKFKTFMQNPAAVENIRALGGEDAVAFFKNLDGYVHDLQKNMDLLDRVIKPSDGARGKELLKRRKAENLKKSEVQIAAKRQLTTQKNIEAESSGAKGIKILERMAAKDFPVQAKGKKLKEWFIETLGITPQAAGSVFSLMKLGIPNTVVSLVGYKILTKLATSKALRDAFIQAAKTKTDPILFLSAFETFANEAEREVRTPNNQKQKK